MTVVLTFGQMKHCVKIGTQRHENAVKRGKVDAYNFDGDPLQTNIDGCYVELAMCMALGRVWRAYCSEFERLKSDVGNNYQGRGTKWRNGGLIVHPRDADDQPFILGRIPNLPEVELVGWYFGWEAKQPRFWNTIQLHRNPAYLVPAVCLHPMRELPDDGVLLA